VDGLKVFQGLVDPSDTTVFRHFPLTTPVRTAWDIARRLPLVDAVPWIDAVARQRRVGRLDLLAYATQQRRTRGVRIAATTFQLCDPRAESPPESVVRVHLHRGGIMAVPQYWIMRDGEFIARADLALPDLCLAIEYDGQWHADPNQLGRDRARLREINQAGWYVHHVTREDLRNPDTMVSEIRAVIAHLRRSRG
jgi:very-short-patch-repair endonuclease